MLLQLVIGREYKVPSIGKISVSFSPSFIKRITNKVNEHITSRVQKVKPELDLRYKSIFQRHLVANHVYLGLTNNFNNRNNLAAEFGLYPFEAELAQKLLLKSMLSVLQVKFDSGSSRSSFSPLFSLYLFGTETSEFISALNIDDEPFSYISTGKKSKRKYRIDWMRWLLEMRVKNINLPIRYNLPAKLVKWSRSGKAIMWKRDFMPTTREDVLRRHRAKKGKRTVASLFGPPYTLPSFVAPKSPKAQNFLEEIFRSRSFKQEINQSFSSVLRSAFRTAKFIGKI